MKGTRILYWIFTGLMAPFMLMACIPDVLQIPEAVAIFNHLGYPTYLFPFIGIAKILGVVVVLVPGFQRLKEWAYAGLVFDLIGAVYSHIRVGDPPSGWAFAVIGLLLVTGSYVFYRKKLTVFKRCPDGAIRLHWASELLFGPVDPGQDMRHMGTVERSGAVRLNARRTAERPRADRVWFVGEGELRIRRLSVD